VTRRPRHNGGPVGGTDRVVRRCTTSSNPPVDPDYSLLSPPQPHHRQVIMPPEPLALLDLVVSQTRQNVEFLMTHGEISSTAGHEILSKLPTTNDIAVRQLTEQTRGMTIPSPPPQPPIEPVPQSGPPARRFSQPRPSLQRAKALWTYNENGSVSAPPPPFLSIKH
jgi:hypothetical protein